MKLGSLGRTDSLQSFGPVAAWPGGATPWRTAQPQLRKLDHDRQDSMVSAMKGLRSRAIHHDPCHRQIKRKAGGGGRYFQRMLAPARGLWKIPAFHSYFSSKLVKLLSLAPMSRWSRSGHSYW